VSSPDLDTLLAVQALDAALARCAHRRSHLEAAAALAELRRRRGELAGERAEPASQRAALAVRQDALEAELSATESRRSATRARLYGGAVSASRDLQALDAELAALTGRASGLEDELLEVMEAADGLDARLADLDRLDVELAGREAELAAEVGRAEAEIDAEVAALAAERAELAAGLPAELLATYERIRTRLGGVGAARLVGGRCDGCHLSLPATELDRLHHLDAAELVTCEQCGRILVLP